MMPETFSLFVQKGITLETSCVLIMYYFSTPRELPTKMDIVEDSALNGEDRGIIRGRCVEASMLHFTSANFVENARLRGLSSLPLQI